MRAVQVSRFGGPEVLELVDLPVPPPPGAGEVLVQVSVAGVNFRDLLHRAGLFGAQLPFVPGTEGAGVVLAAGEGVRGFGPGDRVAWKLGPSYAEQVVVEASETVRVPEGISDEQAGASLLQGLTAHLLASSVYPIAPGDIALVHAGAGGVGHLLTQLVKLRGGRVIATVSSPAKEDFARSAGADEVLVYSDGAPGDGNDDEDQGLAGGALVEAVRSITGGRGVDVAYDGVGRTTFDASLASCRTRGQLVLYGGSSGAVPPFEIMRLMSAGSVTLARPSVRDYTADRSELDGRAGELFGWIASGRLSVEVTGRFALDSAGRAQEALASRKSVGKLVLAL